MGTATQMPTKKKTTDYLTVKQEADTNVVNMYIDGEIVSQEYDDTDVSASGFRDVLKSLGDVKEINLHINSPGGNVFSGIAIYNMLKQSKAKVNIYVDALAASISSVIAMSGDTIFMPENAMLMIHNPWMDVIGNASELRKAADDLDKMGEASKKAYLAKAGDKLDESTIQQIMDNETWLTAQEAYDYGLCDEIVEANQAVASLNKNDVKKFRHVPKQLLKEEAEQEIKQDKEDTKEVQTSEKVDEKKVDKERALLQKIKEEAMAKNEQITAQLLRIKEKD